MSSSKTVDIDARKIALNNNGFFINLKNSVFYIKLTNWEFWPLFLANIPLIFIWLWFAVRARKLFFFSAVNPVIETGGMWGESKYNILKRIPEEYLPVTLFVRKDISFLELKSEFNKKGFVYPVIAKPDVGERGTLVSKIKSEQELHSYFSNNKIDFIIQDYIDLPVELSVMHHRMPDAKRGQVTSICIKETMKVQGDGKSTIEELMASSQRAKLQIKRFRRQFPDLLMEVPEKGKVVELEPIGNHCLGTKFLNGNRFIDEKLELVFDQVGMQMENIYYGRFDLKCNSIKDLKNGMGFKLMEYNGIGAEPAHIYDPSYPLVKKIKDIYWHWKIIYRIYKFQKKKGVKAMSLGEAIQRFKIYSNYQKSLNL